MMPLLSSGSCHYFWKFSRHLLTAVIFTLLILVYQGNKTGYDSPTEGKQGKNHRWLALTLHNSSKANTERKTTVNQKPKLDPKNIPVDKMCLHAQHISETEFSNLDECQQNNEVEWKYLCKVKCPSKNLWEMDQPSEIKLDIPCTGNTIKDAKVPSIPYKDKCLQELIQKHCPDSFKVPNIVHYIWFGGRREFQFHNFLSLYSAHVFQKPCLILIHGETVPFGTYWERTLQVIKNIVHVHRIAPSKIFDKTFKYVEHKADVGRLQALKEYGGIYFDTDTVLLRSLDPLRNLDFSMSQTRDDTIGNGLILSAPNAEFANIWLGEYVSFNPQKWGEHSVYLPFKLSKKYPNLIHVENRTFLHGGTLDQIFMSNFKWPHLYAVHLYIRYYTKCPYNENVIGALNTTLGSTARHVLFGSKELCYKS